MSGLRAALAVVSIVFAAGHPLIAQLDFRRGDANADGSVNISDPTRTLDALFSGGAQGIPCSDAADSNDDGNVNIADAIHTLNSLFAEGAPIPAPGPVDCGPDPTADPLGCAEYEHCVPLFPRPEPDPCDQISVPCESALIGSTVVVSTATEFGISTVVTDSEGTVIPMEWIADGPMLEVVVELPGGGRDTLARFEGALPSLRAANTVGGLICGPERPSGNHAGCDGFLAFFSCTGWGGCCDDHDACIHASCTGANDSGDVRVWFRRWSSYAECRLSGGSAEDCETQFPPFSAECEACHLTVIAWFALVGRFPILGGPSNCCARGDCGALQQCIINGVVETDPRECPKGNAVCWGDPHLTTFDRLAYDFQGVGEFVMARSRDAALEIQARMAPWQGSRRVSITSAVAMNVAGDRVALYEGRSPPLYVNGAERQEGLTLPNGGQVAVQGGSYVVTWPDESEVRVRIRNRHINLKILLSSNHRRSMEGLLGNFDGRRANDLVARDGRTFGTRPKFAALYGDYGESWRVVPAESLFDYFGTPPETFNDRTFPGGPARKTDLTAEARMMAEAECRKAGITDPLLFEACCVDVGWTGDPDSFTESAADGEPAEESVEVSDAPVFDDFESGVGGWGVLQDVNPPVHMTTGGNPGGHLCATDRSTGQTWYWRAPPRFLGDQRFAYQRSFTFDLKATPSVTSATTGDVILLGAGLRLDFNTATNPLTTWTSYSVSLDERAGWVVNGRGTAPTGDEMLQVLGNLTDLRIRGEFRSGADTGCIDNVALGR